MSDYDSRKYTRFTGKSDFDKAIHTLEGILKGISIDNNINIEELNELSAWCNTNYQCINRQPYKELIPYISEAIEDDYLDAEEQNSILWYCKKFKTDNIYYDLVTSDIQRLEGMMHGILSDNKITKEELVNLNGWLSDNEHLISVYPYDELYSLIISVLQDGKIDKEEEIQLKVFFSDHILPATNGSINQAEINEYKKSISISGVCSITPEILFENKNFCFTGKSSKTKRSDVIKVVEKSNGKYINSVSKNTDYLIIGDNGKFLLGIFLLWKESRTSSSFQERRWKNNYCS